MEGDISIIASGEKWIGYGVRSFSSVIGEILRDAKERLVMTIYVLTDMNVVDGIKKALERGVSVEIFMYCPDTSPHHNEAVDSIMQMSSVYEYLKIHRVENNILHAKVLLSDGRVALVGSANPTFGGMVKNYELGFLVESQKIAHKLITVMRRLKG